ncbi:cation channel sperm-associated auxiliary subunit epsilon-like isoform X2 [Engraulis encrasicolus]|uniref:cation channel sperm-associated auxiliary subunit epsilon-like isoform X2 n=1 Tax=Engraulis encrasicolus TaxID=184585 RepID=UPI002FD21568
MPTKSVFMGPIRYNILAAALLLILQNLIAVEAEWRYRRVHRSQKLLLIDESVYLEYYPPTSQGGPPLIGWDVSQDCSLTSTSPVAFQCEKEGFHMVAPMFADPGYTEPARFIHVSKSYFTFYWYIFTSNTPSAGDMSRKVLIWVIDPLKADLNEMDNYAYSPGKNSRFLSICFKNLGQYPTVTLPNSKKLYGVFKDGYWEVDLYWPFNSITIDVTGQYISFKHRFIMDSQKSFYWEPYEGDYFYEEHTMALKLRPGYPSMLHQDPCNPHLSVLLVEHNLYYSLRNFQIPIMLAVVPSYIHPPVDMVEAVVLLEDGIILKMLGCLFWLAHGSKVVEFNPRVFLCNVVEIVPRTTCLSDYPNVAALFQYADGSVSLFMFNLKTRILSRDHLLNKLGVQPIGNLKLHFIESFKESFIMWNGSMMWYSFRDNSDCGILGTKHSPDLGWAAGGSIEEVVVDQNWNLVVRMSNNRLFSCKWGMTELLLMERWLPHWVDSHLHVEKNVISLLWEDPYMSYVQLEPYPLEMERLNILGFGMEHNCPYITFEHNMRKYYYMDQGEEHVFWAQLVYLEGKGVNIQVLRSDMNLLQFEMSDSLDIVAGVFTSNMTITAKLNKLTSSMGLMKVEVVPNLLGHKCKLPANRVSYFSVGCPPSRKIVLRVPTDIERDDSIFNFTIPGSVLRNPQDDDVVMTFDPNIAGPVMKMHYKTAYKPDLIMYEGDKFIKEVDVNFIVWEMNGRTDFSFNTTMEQAGCLREAQTRASVADEAWGPSNYKSCFVLDQQPLGDMAQPYEIMNRSYGNSITFSQQDSAVYMFGVRVVDPEYSFCLLSTVFAIQTTGISKPKHEHLILYVALSFAFVSLCLLAYAYIRYTKIYRDLQKKKHR